MKKIRLKIKAFFLNILNHPKKKVAFIAIVAAAALLVCLSFAWFISQVNLSGSKFQTGTIDFTAKGYDESGDFVTTILQDGKSTDGVENPNDPLFDKTGWTVSDVGTAYISVEKTGTLDMEYDLSFVTGGQTEYLGGYWYRVKEITYDLSGLSGTDDEKLKAYAGNAANAPIPCDANSDSPVTCKTVDGKVVHGCTECKETSYNMTTIDRNSTRGVLQAAQTTKRFYRIDYGVRHTSEPTEYTNKTITVTAKIYATQVGAIDNPDGKGKTFTVSDSKSINEAIDNALPGDSIMLANDITYDGDLVFNKCINFIAAGKTLTVKGNMIYNFVSAHTLKIDLSSSGKIKVVKNGTAGGNFTLTTPNSQVELVGANLDGDLFVSQNMTVHATRAAGTGGCILSNVKILNDTNLPKEIYVNSDTRITVNSGVHIARIEAVAQATNIEIQNSGEIDNVLLSSMNLLSNMKSPQIYIHNYGTITNPIVLPVWSKKFVITQEEPLLTTGNTKIVRAFGAGAMDVTGSSSFTKADIIDETNVDKFVEQITAGDDTALRVYFRDKVVGTTSTLQQFLTDYFTAEGLSGAALTNAINSVSKLEIITIGNKVVANADITYMNSTMISLASINMSKANVVDNTLMSSAFQNKASLTSIQLPTTLTAINQYAFSGTGLTQITIPASVNTIGAYALYNIKYITFESYVPGNYSFAGINTFYLFVNESALDTYRTTFASFATRFYPKAQMCDDGYNFVRELSSGLYELTVYSGNQTNIAAGSSLFLNGKNITVSDIGENAFRNVTNSFALSFDSSVKTIGKNAFYGRSVKSIDFANVKTVGYAAFQYCTQLVRIDTKNVESLDALAFANCTNIIEATLPSVKTLFGDGASSTIGAFSNCSNLTSVSFNSVQSFGRYSFRWCSNLREVYINNSDVSSITADVGVFDGTNKYLRIYTAKENVQQLKALTGLYPNNTYETGEKVGSNIIRLTGTIDGIANTVLGEIDVGQYIVTGTQDNTTIVCCNIETTLTGDYTVPSSSKEIDSTISDDNNKIITTVGDYAYYSTAFSGTNLSFGDNMKAIKTYAFYKATVSTVNFNQVTTVGNSAFYGAAMTTINFGKVTNIDNNAFNNCQYLKTIDENNVIECIGISSFTNCSRLYKVNLPKVIRIGNDASSGSSFSSCPSLISLDIGDTCTLIAPYTFNSTNNIREIFIRSTDGKNTKITNFLYGSASDFRNLKIYVPAAARNDYRAQISYDVFYELGRKVGTNTVTATYGSEVLGNVELGEYMVRDVADGVSVSSYNIAAANIAATYTLPSQIDSKDVVRIGAGCFAEFPFSTINFGTGNTDNFVFPNTVKEIGDYAFCATTVKVSDFKNIVSIGAYSFYSTTNLFEVNAPYLTTVGNYDFYYSNNLRIFNAPKLTTIGTMGFYGTTNLVQLITDAQTVGSNWIGGNTSLRELWVATTPNTAINYTIPNTAQYATYTAADKVVGNYQYDCATVQRVGSAPQVIKDVYGNFLYSYDIGTYMVDNVEGGKRIVHCNVLGTVTGTADAPFEILGAVDGYPVVEIAKSAFASVNFQNCVINIPSSVKTIGTYAFSGKSISGALNLKQVETLGTAAFQSTNITSINAPNLITTGQASFQTCASLVSANMPKVNKLGSQTFNVCSNLKSVYFEEKISFADWTVFYNCPALLNFTINKAVTSASDVPNWGTTAMDIFPSTMVFIVPSISVDLYKASTYFTKFTIQPLGETVTDDSGNKFSLIEKNGGWELLYCTNVTSSVVIPEAYNGKNVVSISTYAFSSVTATSVTLPKYFKYYVNDVFINCSTLQNINVNAENAYFQSIDGVLYTNDGTELVYYPKSRVSQAYTVANNTKMVRSYAFKNNSILKGVYFPATVTVIGADAFSGTTLDYAVFLSDTPPMMTGTSIFDTSNSDLKIYVPTGKVDTYKASNGFIEYDIGSIITDATPPVALAAALMLKRNTPINVDIWQAMRSTVSEINEDYQDSLDNEKGSVNYDVLDESGSQADWKDVLAVYAVKTGIDPSNSQALAAMDDDKRTLLKSIFWDMNSISSQVETKTESESSEETSSSQPESQPESSNTETEASSQPESQPESSNTETEASSQPESQPESEGTETEASSQPESQSESEGTETEVSSQPESRPETGSAKKDSDSSDTSQKVTDSKIYLHITLSHKTAEEMADEYGFTADQRTLLSNLISDESNPLWTVLYGSNSSDEQIVATALSQLGNVGGEPYWSWYGFNSRVEWCACFVSWCANQCGYIDAGVIPKYAGCVQGVQWFKERGQWLENTAEPKPGMIIFFDWNDGAGQDGEADHTGIVEKVENGRVYTIEGNSDDSCQENSYPLGYYEILGYGTPAY